MKPEHVLQIGYGAYLRSFAVAVSGGSMEMPLLSAELYPIQEYGIALGALDGRAFRSERLHGFKTADGFKTAVAREYPTALVIDSES